MITKFTSTFLAAIMIATAIPAMASVASAQPKHDKFAKKQEKFERKRAKIDRQQARYNERNGYGSGTRDRVYYGDQGYRDEGYYEDSQPNVYDRHRKAINIGVSTAAGAVIGALIGGKKGALIGAGVGVATGAIITAKQAPRNYPKYYRRN